MPRYLRNCPYCSIGGIFCQQTKSTKSRDPDISFFKTHNCPQHKAFRRAFVRNLLKTLDLGLEDRLSTKVGLLSGGQRQAVTLLMASMNKPKPLLDEHTAALDPKTAAKVLEITDKIVTENNLTTSMLPTTCVTPLPMAIG